MAIQKGETKTAAQAYDERRAEIVVQIKTLRRALASHRKRHEAQPVDWGFVGDLGHIRETLAEILAFLGEEM